MKQTHQELQSHFLKAEWFIKEDEEKDDLI